jgi:hypothetical protein
MTPVCKSSLVRDKTEIMSNFVSVKVSNTAVEVMGRRAILVVDTLRTVDLMAMGTLTAVDSTQLKNS